MAETLSLLSIISFAIAGVCLALTVFFWFFLKIPTVFGDLTGRNARKSIAKMRAANEKSGIKSFKESKTNAERGKLTGTMPDSDRLTKSHSATDSDKPETGLLADNRADVNITSETDLLDKEETELLDSEATGLLVDNGAERPLKIVRTGGKKLTVIDEVMLIHTEEVIV